MTLDQKTAYVMTGPAWTNYVGIAGGATADFVGVAVGPPVLCGNGIVIPLGGGIDGPGALVSDANRDIYARLLRRRVRSEP
jgi:hypothetical protein